ncbi:MAG: class I SAM-dependent methyltransferase [Rhodospirillales bacterium]
MRRPRIPRRPGGAAGIRPRLFRRCSRRAEDRLVLRPARQPRLRGTAALPRRRLLDAYCYGGSFAVAAAVAGASAVVGIDSSEPALALARRAVEANGIAGRSTFRRAEVFGELERLGRLGERYRVVVADPPAFVRSKKELGSGLRGYRKLARLAAALVEPQGFLFVASCSHNVEPAALLAEVVRGVAAAGRSGRIIREAKAAADHPVHTHLPETAYLNSVPLQLD